MKSLPLFHRLTGQPVLVLGVGEAADAKARLVRRAGGIVIDDMQEAIDQGVRLAFVAHEDDAMAEADAIRLRTSGLLVNVVDRPALCDFTTPSLLDRDPVLIAIGTSGASAGLAKHIRLRLEAILPQSLGKLADALFNARPKLRSLWPDGGDRRRALDSALSEGGALDPLNGDAHERMDAWLAGAGEVEASQTVTITLTSDDPDDLTLRQARLLGAADLVLFDPAISEAILSRCRADAEQFPLGGAAPDYTGLTAILKQRM